MKCFHVAIALLGMCTVFVSSVTVPVDDPDTLYDESEAPLNVATPVAVKPIGGDGAIARVLDFIAVLEKQPISWDDTNPSFTNEPLTYPSNSRLKLTTTLLC